ncbi:hypothetical protein B0H94_107209 [Salsuginibacillus halophilus]|uniref:DUF4129 domain-containing protein n=1 Tax=Salsuginibacillus halophilus TaxID=517424 RepID=A0A2P8HG83_9BACI|nr:hypothetical protein [Salsuginibacillus halophilus]PSL45204.1 hypothetical protein B0H94_107209 [Salsuginibacillus halophilus]
MVRIVEMLLYYFLGYVGLVFVYGAEGGWPPVLPFMLWIGAGLAGWLLFKKQLQPRSQRVLTWLVYTIAGLVVQLPLFTVIFISMFFVFMHERLEQESYEERHDALFAAGLTPLFALFVYGLHPTLASAHVLLWLALVPAAFVVLLHSVTAAAAAGFARRGQLLWGMVPFCVLGGILALAGAVYPLITQGGAAVFGGAIHMTQVLTNSAVEGVYEWLRAAQGEPPPPEVPEEETSEEAAERSEREGLGEWNSFWISVGAVALIAAMALYVLRKLLRQKPQQIETTKAPAPHQVQPEQQAAEQPRATRFGRELQKTEKALAQAGYPRQVHEALKEWENDQPGNTALRQAVQLYSRKMYGQVAANERRRKSVLRRVCPRAAAG